MAGTRSKDRHSPTGKKRANVRKRRDREARPSLHRLWANRSLWKRRAAFWAWLALRKCRPCKDCHEKYPSYVMDFDHVRGKKLFTISKGYQRSRTAVVREIRKCELVCSNCHRERTHQRRIG